MCVLLAKHISTFHSVIFNMKFPETFLLKQRREHCSEGVQTAVKLKVMCNIGLTQKFKLKTKALIT